MNLNKVFKRQGYGELPVFNQGSAPTCVYHTRTNILNSFLRIWNGVASKFGPEQVRWEKDPEDGACGLIARTPAGSFHLRNGTCAKNWAGQPKTPEEYRNLLKLNGPLEIGVPGSCRTFVQAWSRRKNGKWLLPVVKWATNNGPTARNHDIFVIGARKDGLIVQNSWGTGWGKKGKAVLTWEFLSKYGCSVIPYEFEGQPLNTAPINWG